MTAPAVGMMSITGVAGIAGAVQALQAQVAAVAAANHGAAMAVAGPGTEGASLQAMLAQQSNADLFTTHLTAGLEALEEWVVTTNAGAAATEIVEAGNTAAFV